MNVANLQLEGLMIAVASINNLLVHRACFRSTTSTSPRKAGANGTGDKRTYEDMSPANRDAICFPVRLLQIANNAQGEVDIPPFSELAKMVGQTREACDDQW